MKDKKQIKTQICRCLKCCNKSRTCSKTKTNSRSKAVQKIKRQKLSILENREFNKPSNQLKVTTTEDSLSLLMTMLALCNNKIYKMTTMILLT